jgi:PKD repeat protein
MVNRSRLGVPARHVVLLICVAAAWLLATALAPAAHAQGEGKRILLYTGTTGFRHSDAINNGRPVVQRELEEIGFTVDWEDCTNNGGGATNCDNADKNPRIFTDTNLARYDAILLLNSSAGPPGPLWSDAQKASIIKYVQNGGGIAGVHNATDMGTTAETWNWWDGNNANSVVGSTMRGHAATNIGNVAQVHVEDNHHHSTRDLPDTYGFGDEHYNFNRNVRGSHHVLANLDERTYTPGGNAMGQDHPVTWCKLYDGDNVNDNTGTNKAYNDGRTWVTSMGHFGASYTENGGDNNLIKQILGGVRWVAGDGKKSDCAGTVWSSFTRTVLVSDANGPIGIDVAKDGKVYWSEIGNPQGFNSTGFIKMHDPAGEPNNKTTVATILTRADHGNSEDGVLGMSLQPDFDLNDPNKRNVFVYYSPRPGAGDNWPTTGSAQTVGYNQISRFTLNAAGTEVVADSERVILRVPKAKISGNPSGFPGGPTDGGPGHVGGAGLDFDSAGNLYLGVGDDVSPNAPGHGGYTPMDHRAQERWDARKTSANSADLRGKVVRIKPLLGDIGAGAQPGVDSTYTIPAGNMFAPGTPNTRPEIYAMGFRQPFTLHTDPKNPGIVGVGEYCHDANSNGANRAPAGTCEWNLVAAPGFFGWPLCVGNNSALNSAYRWNYAANQTTGQQYDCSQSTIPSDINYAPEGQTPVAPTFQGLENLPGPAVPATIWKKYAGNAGEQSAADFGDLSAGGMQPVAGPIYRYDEATAGPNAFPRYYDGAWLINNRGADSGFWKEVQLRKDNNQFLRVNNWMPYNQAGTTNASFNSLVIGTQFSPAGELYMARFPVTCCRNNTSAANQTQIVKISFNVQDECLTDTTAPAASHEVTGQPYPGQPNTFVNSATLRLSASDVGCAGLEGIEYRVNGETDWHPYTEPLTFTQGRQYSVEYRATDRMDNVAAPKTATFEVLEIDDETAPTADATAAGNKDQRDYFVGSATVTITATDDATGSGVDKIEYRVNGGAWNTYTAPVAFNAPGDYAVDYRATDKVQNTSAPKTLSFKILSGAGCTQARSDEFDGTALGSQWLRHTRNGGTPVDGAMAPTLAGGILTMPTNNFELDAASGTTSLGPVNFIGQDLPSLGSDWSVETQFTVQFTGGWQHAGLIVWQADNNFFRSTITHSLSDDSVYVEQSKDNPTTTEGARVQAGGNVSILPNDSQPVTIRMRYTRTAGANSVVGSYRVIAPASVANPDWVTFPATSATWNNSGGLQLNPSGGVRRDSAGSRVGILAAGNFPGTTGAHPYNGTPATVQVDYFRVTPDPIACETEAPTTTATLDPAAPATGDTYDRAVKVNLSAIDGPANASGVEATEYRVNSNGVDGEWKTFNNANSDSPFVNQLTVSSSGTHVVEFRSRDKAANTEATKSVTFKVQIPQCDRSDEFDGTELRPHWLRHTRNGGTPLTGVLAPTLTGAGILRLPTNDFELDAASATTALGPVNFIGQDIAALGDNWTVETQFKIQHNGGWQHVGLIVWQADNNFFRSTITHSLSADNIYVEQSKDNPTTAEGARQTAGGNRTLLPDDSQPVTIKMRYMRVDGSNSVQAHYQVIAPASIANPDWVAFPATTAAWNNTGGLQLNPTGGPRRDSAGSRIGIIAAGNFPGSTGAGAYQGTPAVAEVDYFRVTPDVCPPGADQTAPTTSHTLAPATPNGLGGYYTSAVNVTLAATDNANGSGIEKTEYRVDGGEFTAYTAPISVAADGDHTVEYRSVDKNGNIEATKSVALKLDQAAPATEAALNPGTPGPGGTYDGPVGLTLTATDATSGVARSEYQVNAVGAFKAFGAPSLAASEALEWVTYDPANKPTFSAPGQYTVDYRSVDNAGNVETAKTVTFSIRAPQTDHDAPVTTASLDPAQPGPGRTYSTAVNVNLSALDPAEEGPAPANFNVNAFGNSWDPSTVNLASGDRITWNFPADEGQPHDVWTVPPGGNPAPGSSDLTQVTAGPVFPGGASVSKTLTQTGTWTFICRLHSSFSEGAWSGMVGTGVVVPGQTTNPPSGVDYTEYRVKTGDVQGDWVRKTNDGGANPFASTFQISAEGEHTVEYRSVDEAGNAETAKSVAFDIDLPDPGFPVIQAFADPSSGKAPLLVRFTATGFDPDGGELTYKWAFADGTALGRAVTRTFTKAGTYTATVTATDDEGKQSSKEVQVVVTSPNVVPPTVEATSDASRGPAPLRVQFNAAGNDPDGPEDDLLYTWDFGDGGTSLAQNPAHTYNAPGTYTAKVTVSEASGATAIDTVEIVVTDPVGNRAPSVEAGALPASGDAPLEVLLTAQGSDPDGDSLTYSWDFDDGTPDGSGRSVTHMFEDGGTYMVKVTASDGRGGTATAEIPVVVGDPPGNQAPTVIAAADPRTGTSPLTVEFSAHAVDPDGEDLLVTWDFGDNQQAAGSEATHTYTEPGTYNAKVTALDPRGATGTATVQVVVSAPAPSQQQTQTPATNNAAGAAGGADAAPAPKQTAWFGVGKPAATKVATFASRGLAVRVTCTEAMAGTAKLTVSSKIRRSLRLKSATLARRTVRCAGAGSESIVLKPSKTVRRVLARAKGSVKATLSVQLRAAGGPATQSKRTLTLKRR